jgi:predicted DNA-binding transcriptional regulator YafY
MRADRLLSILLQLQMHGRLTGRDLAKRLEVSERTIHRDMSSLGSAGVPVVAERGARGGWTLMDGYHANLTGLSEAELHALFVTRPEKLLADLHLVLPKINPELARQRIFIDVTGWSRGHETVPHLPALQDAVWRDRRVRINYGDDVHSSERVLDPLGLVAKGSVWYLVAAIDGDLRSYRVSRVREATILDESFVRPPDFDLEKFWATSAERFKERLPRFPVVIRTREVEWIRRMIRYGAIDSVDGDIVRLHFDAPEVARAFLLGMADQVEVLDPPELRESIVEAARRIINRSKSSAD